jgi:predicted Rossmann-fold nucleotide-binding protein
MSEPHKILVCGSRILSEEYHSFAKTLGRTLANTTNLILVTGGYQERLDKEPNVEELSTDFLVASSAKIALMNNGIDPSQRVITMLPEYEPRPAKHFEIGKVIKVKHSSTNSRRFSMVLTCDGVIAIEGISGTMGTIDLAWAAGKPVLPIPCTDGNARTTWEQYRQDIIDKFGITTKEATLLEAPCEEAQQLAGLCVTLLERCIKPRCFIAMQFSGHPVPNIYGTISEVVEATGYVPTRMDHEHFLGDIVDAIWQSIRSSEILVADLTGYNPNVLYETGIAHTLGKSTILTIYNQHGRVPDDVPFDLKMQRILPYDTADSLRMQLLEEIAAL